jgi:hypothetical protein
MSKLVNRAKMTTATTGTGTITLGAAVSGYQTFAAAGVADGDVVRYVIEDNNDWEIGTGTYTASGTTLSRTVTESSNSGNALNLSGAARVFVSATAADVQTSVKITGGTIDGASVGSTTPAAGAFTTLTLDGTALTATAAELNILDGVTATAAELNQLSGQTAYTRSNILGTVSQSAGVPTGAIIERGSNANGEFVKYADGTMICTRSATVSLNSNSFQSFSLPATFVAIPAASISFGRDASNPADNSNWWNTVSSQGRVFASGNDQIRFLYRGSALNITGTAFFTAIGRWF